MQLNFDKVQGFTVPVKLHKLLNRELAKVETPEQDLNALTFNFRDPSYSAERGGYHPVELRMEKHNDQWQFIYMTDFSYSGGQYPELEREIDVCFETKRVFSLFSGWHNHCDGKALVKLFISNFIDYQTTNAYQTTINFR
ncbi:DUF2787 domain-containing protein [Colwellia sp. 20A7]|uniref:DUF2787 domain-containing protein n=1 Tax=Colwellia sp. 20A7 TaxID=2689569 RepID=UPI00135B0714|nr:DUF2787 domain-containing protein [Colwellia sp. 20A7]